MYKFDCLKNYLGHYWFLVYFNQRIYRIHFWENEFILANPHIRRFKQFIGWEGVCCLIRHVEADQAWKSA